jgi:hypothetical protein
MREILRSKNSSILQLGNQKLLDELIVIGKILGFKYVII